MCSIFFAFQSHPDYRLIVAANRDEFFDRPTAPAASWDDAPGIWAGRDLRGGGTWLGVTESGRFAGVTNYRDPSAPTGIRSRGELVRDFLVGTEPLAEFVSRVEGRQRDYSGFNLLVADRDELWYFSNRGKLPRRLDRGVYGLSNHLLDTPWPKVARGTAGLKALIRGAGPLETESLFDLLRDDRFGADAELPDTGVGLELERVLSPIFIRTPIYGTRSATVLLMDNNGRATFCERTFEINAEVFTDRKFEFNVGSISELAAG